MRRRDFIEGLLLAFAATRTASAQSGQRVRRIGFQSNLAEDDAEAQLYTSAFEQALSQLGWSKGRNLEIEYRWTAGDPAVIRRTAAELVALNPDLILTVGGSQVKPLQDLTSTISILFVMTVDPVGADFVDSLSRPGRNATGFSVFDFAIGAKWLELLRQLAPNIRRVAVLREPNTPSGPATLASVQAAASLQRIEVSSISLRGPDEIERGLTAFAREPDGGLIVAPNSRALVNRATITALAERFRLPAIYPFRLFVTEGGLIYYGPDVVNQYRQAAAYADRILKGERPADLPVQQPTKYEMTINLKTAKAIGVEVPESLISRADALIE
jgi:putative tryptophan/tyrosine transport system substrate-binding protein